MLVAFIKGVFTAILLGVPAGPIGVLAIQNTMKYGFRGGVMTGLGSALADLIYAAVGVFGISLVQDVLLEHQTIMTSCGAVLMFILGIWMIYCRKQKVEVEPTKGGMIAGTLAALVIALSNPASMLAFFFAFSTFGVANGLDATSGVALLVGVFVGGFAWWFMLAGLVMKWKERMSDRFYVGLKWFCGIVLIGFGVGILAKSVLGIA